MKWATGGGMDQDDITLLPAPLGECSESRCQDGNESTASGGPSESAGSGSELSGKTNEDAAKASRDNQETPRGNNKDAGAQSSPQLPSVGSAQHATGECKPCLFFPKGSCTNGETCNFCHFKHETRRNKKKSEKEGAESVRKIVGADGGKSNDVEESAKPTAEAGDERDDAEPEAAPAPQPPALEPHAASNLPLSKGSASHPEACTECQYFFFSQSGCNK